MTTIPPITDPLGRYWGQPSSDEILVDDEIAMMTKPTLEKLLNYERSIPTGTYVGKMWRRGMMLCWFSEDPDPKFLKNNYRPIILV